MESRTKRANFFSNHQMLFLEKFETCIKKHKKKTKDLIEEDPRRVIHGLKAGLALTLVSLLYYCRPLYNAFGISAMCAIITFSSVFEFSVGGTLSKAFNQGVAAVLGILMGIGVHYLSRLFGGDSKPIFLCFVAFLLCVATSFVRFFPRIKARYDSGVLGFIATFLVVALSGYRVEEILDVTYRRFLNVVIGAVLCVLVSIFVHPVWAGQDLHNLVALNIEKVATFLQGFGDECFELKDEKICMIVVEDDKMYNYPYQTVLDSCTIEENQAGLARWEPPHGEFRFDHPWKQYLKIGNLTRECCYHIATLKAFIHSHSKDKIELNKDVYDELTKISFECGKSLDVLSISIRSHTLLNSYNDHVDNSKVVGEILKSTLETSVKFSSEINKSENHDPLLDAITIATIVSMLAKIVSYGEEIAKLVQELALLSRFKLDLAKKP